MEKFAVDLDKVLDEFEFNEDCAEQVIPLEQPQAMSLSLNLINSSQNQHQSPSIPKIPLDYDKSIPVNENREESGNVFLPLDYRQTDDKVQKRLLDSHKEITLTNDNEPTSSTIHNDIIYPKFAKKYQNNKDHNTYDKKLNQSNSKPSVSNVFSSLNDYINAPSTNIEQCDKIADENIEPEIKNMEPEVENDSQVTELKLLELNSVKKITDSLPTCNNILGFTPSHLNVEQEDKSSVTEKTSSLEKSTNILSAVLVPVEKSIPRKISLEIASRDKEQCEDLLNEVFVSNTVKQMEIKYSEDIKEKEIEDSEAEDEALPHNSLCEKNSNLVKPITVRIDEKCAQPEKHVVNSNNEPTRVEANESIDISIDTRVFLQENQSTGKITTLIKKPVGFGSIKDLSEEEVNRYLTELEAEQHKIEVTNDVQNDIMVSQTVIQQKNDHQLVHNSLVLKNVEIEKLSDILEEQPLSNVEEVSKKLSDTILEDTVSTLNDLNFIEASSSEKLVENSSEIHEEVNVEEVKECSSETKENSEAAECIELRENFIIDKHSQEAEVNMNSEGGTEKPTRPQTLDIISTVSLNEPPKIESSEDQLVIQEEHLTEQAGTIRNQSPDTSDNSSVEFGIILGKQPPFWVPDADAPNCMLCDVKFNVIKRRHHCRACGKVLCNKCCSMKYRLEYQGNMDSRVCSPCYQQLTQAEFVQTSSEWSGYENTASGITNLSQERQPNPNNPMEYCSTIPPLQQLNEAIPQPPSVMVPVGVLKREGSTKQRVDSQKSVMFSDGIRPGCDLTELDITWDSKSLYHKPGSKRIVIADGKSMSMAKKPNLPQLDPYTNSYIPQNKKSLPPTVTIHKGQISYHEAVDPIIIYDSLKDDSEPPVMFAINRNLYAYVKITNLNCCVNKTCWNITSRGLACVGQDEVIFLVEVLSDETQIPRDLLIHINQIYIDAIKGNTITELGMSIFQGHQGENLLDSREHAGFLFIRSTFQCLQKIVIPPAPFLVGILVHRWETPWAKIFPLRLILRLGAEYRYYPCPLVSVRFRDAVYFEIGHTIMKVLADFRNYAYTLPSVRGLFIHMENRKTDILLPRNRYDQVMKGLKNSNDYVLAFAANFSFQADSHLVCVQSNTGDESTYQTQAINIHNKPRKLTGASFIVINGALKSSMGLSAKSSIVEDGIMVQIMPEQMETLKIALKNMQNFSISCGKLGTTEADEVVNINWVDNDVQFNVGVKSPVDGQPMDGIPSIRVHNSTNYMGTSRFIRWTEVFIMKSDDHPHGVQDPVDINKLAESISRATCTALVKLLDLLATAGLTKLAVRVTIHPDNVGYEAGSEGTRLPPLYMNSLDNELIQVLHKAAHSSQDTSIVLELIFHILDDK